LLQSVDSSALILADTDWSFLRIIDRRAR